MGVDSRGESILNFTHRTFLEYFAADHAVATTSGTEELARVLMSRIALGDRVVPEFALSIVHDDLPRELVQIVSSMQQVAATASDRSAVDELVKAVEAVNLAGPGH